MQSGKVTLAIETPQDFLNVLSERTIDARYLGLFHACLEVGDSNAACQRIKDYFIADINQ